MEILTKCRALYEELRDATERMDEIEEMLQREPDVDRQEQLLMEEFDIAMQISGAYGDLMYALERLERDKQGMSFFVKRMKQNANTLLEVKNVRQTK